MKLCGKSLPKAKNGADRGLCSRLRLHTGKCGNATCSTCAIKLSPKNCPPSWLWRKNKLSALCRLCARKAVRLRLGQKPQNYQQPGKKYTFRNCGCSGILPPLGGHNKFAKTGNSKTGPAFHCRVSRILSVSQISARERGYAPVPKDTPHSVIRKMMDEPNCERCGQPLEWEFGQDKTPHLHHNHETGEPYGFTHPVCNPRAMEQEIERLKKQLRRKK